MAVRRAETVYTAERGYRLTADRAVQLARLAPARRGLLDRAAAVALAHAAPPYLVGGGVRDLLLGRATLDLDVVVVGDALAVARALHDDLGGAARARLRAHEAFGTATLTLHDGPALDLITARREQYPAPGALPLVFPGSLDDDLRRRDFTINAIALDLAPGAGGALLDPLGGRADLAAGVIRVLHEGSFADDPTRLLRAARYAGRLAFDLAPRTAALFRAAVGAGALGTVTPQRLSHEFVRLLAEPLAATMLDALVATDALAQIAPGSRWDDESRAANARLVALSPALPSAPGGAPALWAARFALLVAHLAPEAAWAVASGLHVPGGAIELARQVATLRALLAQGVPTTSDAALGRLLDPFSAAAVATTAALLPDPATRQTLLRYLTTIRSLVPRLGGAALKALGVAPGPIYREALGALRDFKRDTPDATSEDERAFLQRWLALRGAG